MESSSVTAIPSYAEARPYNARGGSDMPASPPTMAADRAGCAGQWALCESRVAVHPSDGDHHPTTPAASLRYSPLRQFFPLLAPCRLSFKCTNRETYMCVWDAGTSCVSVFFSSSFFFSASFISSFNEFHRERRSLLILL